MGRLMQTGIIGLPQVGKTTLFRILTRTKMDEKSARAATHVGVARVPEPEQPPLYVGASEPGEPGLRLPPRYTPPPRPTAAPAPAPEPKPAIEPEPVPEAPRQSVQLSRAGRLPREWNVWELDRIARDRRALGSFRRSCRLRL